MSNAAIENTMLIPLWNRARASRLYPEILNDQMAIDIVEHLGVDFSEIDAAFDEFSALSHLVRAKNMDDAVRSYAINHPDATVVNIGAGLDTGYWRVENEQLHWYDLDLPHALQVRNQIIIESNDAKQIAKSVFDYSWFEDIAFSKDKGAIFLAAGVFYFFHEEQVRALLIHMAEAFPNSQLIFDANSSQALTISNEMMQKSGNRDALMYFSVDDASIFARWSDKIMLNSSDSRFQNIPRLPQMSEDILQKIRICDDNKRILQISLSFLD